MAMGFNAISYSGDFYVYAAALQAASTASTQSPSSPANNRFPVQDATQQVVVLDGVTIRPEALRHSCACNSFAVYISPGVSSINSSLRRLTRHSEVSCHNASTSMTSPGCRCRRQRRHRHPPHRRRRGSPGRRPRLFIAGHGDGEGHRFAVQPIPTGAPLLSSTCPSAMPSTTPPGQYVCNKACSARSSARARHQPAQPAQLRRLDPALRAGRSRLPPGGSSRTLRP